MATQSVKHLGRSTQVPQGYDPNLLEFLPRNRVEASAIPYAADLWTLYEVGWLDPIGILHPLVGDLTVHYASANLVESKSLKLYLYGLAQQPFASLDALQACILSDLQAGLGAQQVSLNLYTLDQWHGRRLSAPAPTAKMQRLEQSEGATGQASGLSEDKRTALQRRNNRKASDQPIHEMLMMEGFITRCPVTGQPDWATIQLEYLGRKMDPSALYAYLAAYRLECGFHEQCMTQIYSDLLSMLQPKQLTVYARFTRRGGIDINPYRSNCQAIPLNYPNARQ